MDGVVKPFGASAASSWDDRYALFVQIACADDVGRQSIADRGKEAESPAGPDEP